MNRRAFLLFGSMGWTVTAKRAVADPLRTVGVLMGLSNDAETQARAAVVEHGLVAKGWALGKNLRIEYRYGAGDPDRIIAMAKELVQLRPDVIIGHSTPCVAALHHATSTIPIVFVVVADPVGSGFVASLARPGGNITGFMVLQPTITGKYLSILRELEPQLNRAAVMFNPKSVPSLTSGPFFMPEFIKAAKQFNVSPASIQVSSADEIKSGIAELGASSGSALIVMPDNFTTAHRRLIIDLAAQWRVPTIYSYRYFADEGGLLSYGVDVLDLFRRAPDYVDRILRGALPANLPVQAPRRFELVINLKTARELGLVVPRILLAGADALIE